MHLFQGNFRYYRDKPRPVRGKIHVSEESYRLDDFEQDIRPMGTRKGIRNYIMMHPYVPEPILTLRVGLYEKPKHYADQDAAIGETLGEYSKKGSEISKSAALKPGTTIRIRSSRYGSAFFGIHFALIRLLTIRTCNNSGRGLNSG